MELQQLLFSIAPYLLTVGAVAVAYEALRSKNNQKRIKTIFCLASSQALSHLNVLLALFEWFLTQEQPLVANFPVLISSSLIGFTATTLHYLLVLFSAHYLVKLLKTKD